MFNFFSHEHTEIRMYVSSRRTVAKNQSVRMIHVDDRALLVRDVSNYSIRNAHTTSTCHLIDGLALKDNDQCGHYYVNDLADVSKMRLRVAEYSARSIRHNDAVCASSGDYDLPNDVQTNNENGLRWSSDLLYTTSS